MGIIHRICHDCCNFKRHNTNNKPVTCRNFLGFVIVKLILEVFGAAGAIWGSSDGQCHCYMPLLLLLVTSFAFNNHWTHHANKHSIQTKNRATSQLQRIHHNQRFLSTPLSNHIHRIHNTILLDHQTLSTAQPIWISTHQDGTSSHSYMDMFWDLRFEVCTASAWWMWCHLGLFRGGWAEEEWWWQ